MQVQEFEVFVSSVRVKHPRWFEGSEGDPPASPEEIRRAEECLNVEFCAEYSWFLKAFGGGDFAFSSICSVREGSTWNIVTVNQGLLERPERFLAFSSNGCGDFYGFTVSNARASGPVLFWDHETGEIHPTRYGSFFEFLKTEALEY